MKRNVVSFALLVSACTFGSVNSVLADSVYVKGNRILLADGDLYIYSTSDPNTPLDQITIGNATDVAVSECKAIVTTDDGEAKGIAVVDLDNIADLGDFCSSDDVNDEGENANDCKATYNPKDNTLMIPCVEAFGSMYTLQMKQRGKSDNWYVDFIEEQDD